MTRPPSHWTAPFLIVCGAALAACGASPKAPIVGPSPDEPAPVGEVLQGRHRGPSVVSGPSGPARFVRVLYDDFDLERAMDKVRFVDRYYRAPGNDGYQAVLDELDRRLRAAGFGEAQGFELFELEAPLTARGAGRAERVPAEAWTPLAAELTLLTPGKRPQRLHGFSEPGDPDRVMLPVYAPSADVEGPVAFSLEELDAGELLVTDAPPKATVLTRAQNLGAVAVVSSNLESYNTDPSGQERHLDAVQFRTLSHGSDLPVAMISARSMVAIRAAAESIPGVHLRLRAEVRLDARPLRTLVARVVGADRPQEAVAVCSHVQEPGACDNASGVAGLAETAIGLAQAIREGRLPRPSRSLVFLWGDEFRQTETWLENTDLIPVAGLSSDMTGESRERTGAIALLERMPDPGALVTLPPDEHTPWGGRPMSEDDLHPNGLAVLARCALMDVAQLEGGLWETADHPFEGGSDHDVFIERGLPAALFWHFTDFAYHTSLDRIDMVDATEMRRTGVALMATALALADPRPEDLDRYLRSLDRERDVRIASAQAEEDDAELIELWQDWCYGARQWLRIECLRIPPESRPSLRRDPVTSGPPTETEDPR